MFSAPGNPPPAPHSLSFVGIGTVKTCTKKSRKTRFSQAIFPSHPSPPPFLLSPCHPHGNPSQNRRGAAGNPGFFKQIAPIFEKLLSAEAKLDVCPRKGVNEGHGGGDAWGGKVVKIAGPMRAFLVERQHSSSF